MRRLHRFIAFAAFLLLGVPPSASAEQSRRIGDVVVHYNALSTEHLPASMASTYGFERSNRRGLVNISVQREAAGAVPQVLAAKVQVTAIGLTGHRQRIEMREIREGDTVDYIGDFPVAPPDTLRFEVEVVPAGADRALSLEFSKEFAGD